MAKVKVVNENTYPFQQEYKGELVKIPAKGQGRNWVEMDRDEAVMFLGLFYVPKMDFDGNPEPSSYKMLKIEPLGSEAAVDVEVERHVCQKCRFEAKTAKDLDAHIEAQHEEDWADEEFKEKKAEVKRGRGRPRKETKHEGENIPAT